MPTVGTISCSRGPAHALLSGCEALPELRRGRRGVLVPRRAEPLLTGCGLCIMLLGLQRKGEEPRHRETRLWGAADALDGPGTLTVFEFVRKAFIAPFTSDSVYYSAVNITILKDGDVGKQTLFYRLPGIVNVLLTSANGVKKSAAAPKSMFSLPICPKSSSRFFWMSFVIRIVF